MKTKIGGQAVLEGVMMRGEKSMALAVRDEQGTIRLDSKRLQAKKPWYKKVPFLRGSVNLVLSMIDGIKILNKSAEVQLEDETSNGGMGLLMAISMLIGIGLALLLFIVVPTELTKWIMLLFNISEVDWVRSLIEGFLKFAVLVLYMSSISLMKDIKRVFMYHGAEHKTISCFENGLPLTVENVQKCSRYHDRCGTSFVVFVVILSIVLMLFVEAVCYSAGFNAIKETWVRILLKIAMLPFTAGVSYEMLMLLARSNFVLFRPLKWFGKQFQKLTTKEPDNAMCEVALAAFCTVLEMDQNPNIPEVHFPQAVSLKVFLESLKEKNSVDKLEQSDFEFMLCDTLNVKRNELKPKESEIKVSFGRQLKIQNAVERMLNGEPFQYILKSTEFFGRKFAVDSRVLIPRMETELVAEEALKHIEKENSVLDLCCGSGVLGLTAALEKGVRVTLADISEDALAVARANAKTLKVKNAVFVQTDMFENLKQKFDVIVCNPPYVKSGDIEGLESKVKDFEPLSALDGGTDGLDFYRKLAQKAADFLNENGVLVLEIGYDQGPLVQGLLESGPFGQIAVKTDYSGNDRLIIAKLQ